MSIQKVEMTVEQKENGQYVEQVAYPYVEYDHVTMENGMDIMSMIRDDVSTPTVTHDTISWKVGQGDSDVSNSIVDSSVASMTIKGQTYQNILPSPSLRNSMTDGTEMQKINEGQENVEVVDGEFKSAILSGQTKYKDVETGEILDEFDTEKNLELVSVKMPVLTTTGKNLFDGEIKNNKDINYDTGEETGGSRTIPVNFIPVKENTYYTFTRPMANKSSSARYYDKYKKYIGSSTLALNGTFSKIFLTPSNCAFMKFIDESNIADNNYQIEENSTPTTYEPYKSSIASCNEEITLRGIDDVKDTLDLATGELTQRIGIREYQEGDEINATTITDLTNTCYVLTTPIIKTVDLSILNQDNQPITQLNSFAGGYIQVSSQGLIPSVEYEVPTSNSYHVDLMKPNTQYTMKNMQGTFTIDGIQYNASANGTFTSPSTLTNKFMIASVAQSQPMLLEGDMTSEEVPYVEGIKSAFEGVDKIEIVSQNADNSLSNTTSFQLPHPLRSLPNGVRDEIVLDRMSNKAKLIQRVGIGVLDGTQTVYHISSNVDTSLYQPFMLERAFTNMLVNTGGEHTVVCDKLAGVSGKTPYRNLTFNAIYQYSDGSACLVGQITQKDLGGKTVQNWFKDNPTTLLYQLATPIVTEVNLEGYPYVYKDGHIFLNTEIAPITEVTYSINQAHQIESSNEDILRHQKEINHLYELIAQYVQVQYEAELIDIALQG